MENNTDKISLKNKIKINKKMKKYRKNQCCNVLKETKQNELKTAAEIDVITKFTRDQAGSSVNETDVYIDNDDDHHHDEEQDWITGFR